MDTFGEGSKFKWQSHLSMENLHGGYLPDGGMARYSECAGGPNNKYGGSFYFEVGPT